MLRVIVLGSAAGGGLPQWNCNCGQCQSARLGNLPANGQMSLAVSCDDGLHWFLINASPDLRQQIITTKALAPRPGRLRDSPIAGVILTNAEVDAITGLLSLREAAAFSILAHPKVLATLAQNSIFDALDPVRVPRIALTLNQALFPLLPDGTPSGLKLDAFDVPGKVALYLEGAADATTQSGDTIGLNLTDLRTGARVCIIAGCAAITPELEAQIAGADLLFFDGTLWSDDEMIRAGLGNKTGQRMGHMSMSGPDGVIARLAHLDIGRRVFVHVNNSNPVHDPASAERRQAEEAGWCMPAAKMEFTI